jgi:hypothetical protein
MVQTFTLSFFLLFASASSAQGLGINSNRESDPVYRDQKQEKKVRLAVYPNPTSRIVTVDIDAGDLKENFTLRINNAAGQNMHSENLPEISGSFSKKLDLESLPKGLYFIELLANPASSYKDAIRQVAKLVLQ